MTFEIGTSDTLGILAGRIAERIPALAHTQGLRLALNRAYVPLNQVLSPSDEVAVIPPVSGGSCLPDVMLTRDPIDVAKYTALISDPQAGAIATFVGVVRSECRNGVGLTALDYYAYEEMALEQLREIRERAIAKFGLIEAIVIHRLGLIALGEASIFVCVNSGHRAEAFDAVRWIVDSVKNDVPIWKKDVWADQSTSWTAAPTPL